MVTVLLELALKSLLVAALGLALLRATRRRSASERSLIAHLVLVALVALPLAQRALPGIPLPVLPAVPVPACLAKVMGRAPGADATLATAGVAASPVPRAAGRRPLPTDTTSASAASTACATCQPSSTARADAGIGFDWTPYAYAAPAVGLLLLTAFALLRLVALSRSAEVLVEPVWLSALAHAQRRMGFKSGTALLVSDDLPSPISWGWARPVIVLNRRALTATDEAEAIIAHELAHVVSLDWAKLMLARVATAMYWFNPLVWWLAREAHQLREEAADDAVLATAIPEVDYAQLLVGVARHEADGLLLGAHGVAPGRDSLRRRVGRVLDTGLARAPAGRSWMAGFGAGMLVMTAPLAALTVAARANPAHGGDAHPVRRPALAELSRSGGADARVGTAADGTTVVRQPGGETVTVSAPDAHGRRQVVVHQPDGTTVHTTDAAGGHEVIRRPDGETVTISAADARGRRQVVVRQPDGTTVRATQAAPPRQSLSLDGRPTALPALANAAGARPLADVDVDDSAIEEAMALKAMGVAPGYVAALEAAGPWLGRLSVDDISEMHAVGVTPEYVRGFATAGLRPSRSDLVEARAVGLNGDYARSMVDAGYHGSLNRLIEMRVTGLTPADLTRRSGPRTRSGVPAAPVPPEAPATVVVPAPPAPPYPG